MDIQALLSKREELDPELKAYYEHNGSLGPMIRHPLVYSIPHLPELNALANEQLRAKKEYVEKAMAERDFGAVIWMHERPHRVFAFLKVASELTDEQYWEMLGHIYVDTENFWQNRQLWRHLLTNTQHDLSKRVLMMSEHDRTIFEDTPAEVTVFRGYFHRNKMGFSWTLVHRKAWWFAKRLAIDPTRAKVIRGLVSKKDIIAVFTERGESEVVVDPRNVCGIRYVGYST